MNAFRWATVTGGVVGEPRPYAERDEGFVQIHDAVQKGDTTPDGGTTFYRDGELLKAPPLVWTSLEFLMKFTDTQKIMLYRAAAVSDEPALLMMHLFTAQEVISNHPMTVAARAALLPMLGESETIRIFDQP